MVPSQAPSNAPSQEPSALPSLAPSQSPSSAPTFLRGQSSNADVDPVDVDERVDSGGPLNLSQRALVGGAVVLGVLVAGGLGYMYKMRGSA